MCESSNSKALRFYRCEHGTFHLTIDGTTVQLSPSKARALLQLMGKVKERYGEELGADVASDSIPEAIRNRMRN